MEDRMLMAQSHPVTIVEGIATVTEVEIGINLAVDLARQAEEILEIRRTKGIHILRVGVIESESERTDTGIGREEVGIEHSIAIKVVERDVIATGTMTEEVELVEILMISPEEDRRAQVRPGKPKSLHQILRT